jgi:hypothetical protein
MAEAALPDPPTEIATANRALWTKVKSKVAVNPCAQHPSSHTSQSHSRPRWFEVKLSSNAASDSSLECAAHWKVGVRS